MDRFLERTKNIIKQKITACFYVIEIKIGNWLSEYKTDLFRKQLKSGGNNIRLTHPVFYKNLECISIGNNFRASNNLRIEAWQNYNNQRFEPLIKIGDNVNIQQYCHIGCINEIIIEDNVLIASNVFITDHYHGYISDKDLFIPPTDRKLFSKGVVRIGKNVWIGQGVSIMPGINIGENSIIGSNSVVTKDIPSNCVAAGIPAKVIKYLHEKN